MRIQTLESFATFFGWCSVINIGLILLVLLLTAVIDKDGPIIGIGAKIFGISKEELRVTHFRVFQQYRFAVVAFNIVPYFALHSMM